jgi:hypothetical protein
MAIPHGQILFFYKVQNDKKQASKKRTVPFYLNLEGTVLFALSGVAVSNRHLENAIKNRITLLLLGANEEYVVLRF